MAVLGLWANRRKIAAIRRLATDPPDDFEEMFDTVLAATENREEAERAARMVAIAKMRAGDGGTV